MLISSITPTTTRQLGNALFFLTLLVFHTNDQASRTRIVVCVRVYDQMGCRS